ncbi:PP2C family serine/threonine-protein phosphatase [Streptacidiphilus sp. P02-A3a]|uniref:PP2C family protein-serine/threonine phosphatase n=1 Tax=Streptacidiphilus sp. P02-A3a TaxID=2704468 RepID=UPI0015F91EA9|nr:PP2C family serine/threonine-protein phosphatase [Streptacidiphilus sp. P02-A3a]QMU66859.1 protein phosphatase [Streptacidiphilus sp. P02-A3a]
MSLVLRFAAGSHKGMIREGNEDSGYAGPRLLAVADGMGGQAAGEVASSEVLSTMVSLDEDIPGTDPLTALSQAADRANERLRLLVESDPSLEGMGTTLTALLWTGERAGLIHIGDSRAYLLRDGSLTQITQDHTWVQRLVDEGRITEEEASTHPQRSLIMRALMGTGEVESDLSIREVRAGDRYLICSDGLSGVVSHQTLEETLGSYYAPEQTIAELIQLALRGGGPDNITCVVADVLDIQEGDPAAGQLSEVPMVVGAVADGPPTISHQTMANTPAARAASLGRPQPPGGADGYGEGYDPAAYGEEGYAEGDYEGEDYAPEEDGRRSRRKQRSGRKRGCLVPSLVLLVVLGLVGGGGFAGYQWTRTQYFIGAHGDHVAVYQGVNQNLAGLSLSKVYRDYPGIPLKDLPSYQQTSVHNTISTSGLNAADTTITQLQSQATLCQQIAAAPPSTAPTPAPAPSASGTPKTPKSGADSKPSAKPSATVSAPASLSPQQQQLAQQCPTS